MYGIDGVRMVTTTNLFESVVLSAASRRAAELASERDDALAESITGKIVKAWNKGQKK
jgi:2-C-methyl-D-erythritol 4-phosphate cytidylyltransferase